MRGLDFENERWCRVYTRDTADWLLLSWQARALYLLITRKLDRAGLIELGQHEPAKATAAVVGMPLDVVAAALPELVAPGGLLELRDGYLLDPTFLEAQEAAQSDVARSRAARERRRDQARAAAIAGQGVTKRDGSVTAPIEPVEPPAPDADRDAKPEPVADTKRVAPVTKRDAPNTKRDKTVTARHAASLLTIRSEPSEPSDPEIVDRDQWGISPDGDADAPPKASSADADTGESSKKAVQEREDIKRVFALWQREMNHPKARLDAKRTGRIRARLREGFTPDELEAAIRGAKLSTWHMGENPDGKVFDGIETILRDAAQVEKFRDLHAERGRPRVQRPPPRGERKAPDEGPAVPPPPDIAADLERRVGGLFGDGPRPVAANGGMRK